MKRRLLLALVGIMLAVAFRRKLAELLADGLTKTTGTWVGSPR